MRFHGGRRVTRAAIAAITMLMCCAVYTPAALAQANQPDEQWSPAVREACIETPETLDRAVHLELLKTWNAGIEPVMKQLVDDGRVSTLLFPRSAGEDGNYLLFTAIGQSSSRVVVPAYEDIPSRRRPALKVTYQLMPGRPDLVKAAAEDAPAGEQRGDGNVSTMTVADGEGLIQIESRSADGTADAQAVLETLQRLIEEAGFGNFPYELPMAPIVPSDEDMEEPAPREVPAAKAEGESPDDEFRYVRMTTTMGDIVLALNLTKAPISTKNFLQYVQDGFYDGTIFHRVIADFMIQGGGFDENLVQKQTRSAIRNEWRNGLKNTRGTIAMARLGNQPDSATSQFFINVKDNPGLDQPRDGAGYAVFGKVVDGMEVVEAIRYVRTGAKGRFRSDVPQSTVLIEQVRQLETWPMGE